MNEENKDIKVKIGFSILLFTLLLFIVGGVFFLLNWSESVQAVPLPVMPPNAVTAPPTQIQPIDSNIIYNNEYIIIWSDEIDPHTQHELLEASADFEFVSDLAPNMTLVRCDKYPPSEIIDRLSNIGGVKCAEPNFILELESVSEDPYSGAQWALHNNGYIDYHDFVSGTGLTIPAHHDIDINFPEAKELFESTYADPHEVIVAVIDTGADISHPDLAGKIWVNSGEIPGDGIDNDGNGYIDDIYGWDFYNDDNTVFHPEKITADTYIDNDTHGTLIAGIIAAIADNSEGIAGAASFAPVKIMVLKANGGSGNGSGKVSDAIQAINYATAMGAKVCNISWGISRTFSALESLKTVMQQSDMLFVCAAGNSGTNNDEVPIYPANLGLPNSMSVTMCDHYGKLVVPSALTNYGSNYGANTVDIAAPGVTITSTVPEGKYNTATGSSFAAPYVSAIAAVIMSARDKVSAADVKKIILSTAKNAPAEPTPSPEVTEAPLPTASPEPEATDVPTASPEPEATDAPMASPEPEATDAPMASPEPEPTAAENQAGRTEAFGLENSVLSGTPTPTNVPTATVTPAASVTPAATVSPEVTAPLEPTTAPETTASPEASATPAPTATPEPSPTPGFFADMETKVRVPGIPDMYAALKAAAALLSDDEIPEIEFTRTFDGDVIVLTATGIDTHSGVRILRYDVDESLEAYKTLAHFARGTTGLLYEEPLRFAHAGIYSFYVSDYAGNEKVIQYVLKDDVAAPEIKLLTTATSPSGKLVAVLDVTDFESGVRRFSLLPGERSAADFSVAENAPTTLEPVDGRLLLRFNSEEVYTLCAYDHRGNISTYTLRSN